MGGALLLATAVACLAIFGSLAALSLGLRSLLRVAVAAYVVAWAGLTIVTALLSFPAWLSRTSLGLALVALAPVSVAVWASCGRPSLSPRREVVRDALHEPLVRVLAVALLVAGIYLTALAFFTTPNDWDGLTYHETRALLWDQQGRVGYVPSGNDPRLDGNPPVSEIGLYLAMLLPRSERFAALPQYLALVACVLAVMLVAHRLGLSTPESAYGGLVFATLPIVFLQGAAVLNDLVVASFLLATVVFLSGTLRAELALGSIALGLALGTKLNAVLVLPVLVVVVLALAPRARRGPALLACGAGVLLGSPWYVLNLVRTGSLDGGLGEDTGQTASHSFGAIVGSLRALSFDVVDVSGLWRADLWLAVAAGCVVLAAALVGAGRGTVGAGHEPGVDTSSRPARSRERTLAYAGLLAAATPLVLRSLDAPGRYLWKHGWLKLGREDIALDHGDAWKVQDLPDTSLSWFGAAGTIVIVGGIAAAIIGVRRRDLPRSSLALALAPAALVAIFAFTIVYDPWRGRLLVFAVGLACAAWGWTLRVRWLATGVTVICVSTLALASVNSYTKPSGLGLLEPSLTRSVWHRDRIDTLTVIRDFDGTPALLRAVESSVSPDAHVAVATPIDAFLAPLAGPRLSRTLRLIRDGARVPSDATWLVTRAPAVAVGCAGSWRTVFTEDSYHWRLLRRVGPDTCGDKAAPF